MTDVDKYEKASLEMLLSRTYSKQSGCTEGRCTLGHNLEEIRVRSLQNILSKLDHGLVCDLDLVQEKQLHIRLLEWFNFPSCVMHDKVLALIFRLSKVRRIHCCHFCASLVRPMNIYQSAEIIDQLVNSELVM